MRLSSIEISLHSTTPLNTASSPTGMKWFTTVRNNQTEVRIRVRQGINERASDDHFIGSFLLKGITPGPKGSQMLEVGFSVNENGILHATATEVATHKTVQAEFSLNRSAEKDIFHYMFILDMSGSMNRFSKRVIDGFNNILHFLQNAEREAYGTEEHRISLILFSGRGVITG